MAYFPISSKFSTIREYHPPQTDRTPKAVIADIAKLTGTSTSTVQRLKREFLIR